MVTRVTFPPVQGEWVRATEYEALAAHVERLSDAVCKEGAGPMARAVIDSDPVDSLARRDARMRAAGAYDLAHRIRYDYEGEIHQDRIADFADDVACELRRQAEEPSP